MNARSLAVLLLSAVPSLFPPTASAQPPSPERQIEALKKVDLWVGTWKGSGWSMSAGGERAELTLTETVTRKCGGTVLFAEGRATRPDASGAEVVTHDGIGMLFYDDETHRYRWHGHDLPWGAVDGDAELVDGGFRWSFRSPRGHYLRFTIVVDATQWHEMGEIGTDGRAWTRFMEMTLTRQR